MIPEGFKSYIQSTCREDVFDYKVKALGKILAWGSKWQPDSIELFRNIITKIKAGKGEPDKNPLKKNGKYISRPGVTGKYMTIFFEPPQPPTTQKFIIYDFAIGDYKI